MVVKKDGRREPFDLDKIRKGLYRAMEKRPVQTKQIEQLARQVEEFFSRSDREVPTVKIGEMIMEKLKNDGQGGLCPFRLGLPGIQEPGGVPDRTAQPFEKGGMSGKKELSFFRNRDQQEFPLGHQHPHRLEAQHQYRRDAAIR